jgi:hypothetical protein
MGQTSTRSTPRGAGEGPDEREDDDGVKPLAGDEPLGHEMGPMGRRDPQADALLETVSLVPGIGRGMTATALAFELEAFGAPVPNAAAPAESFRVGELRVYLGLEAALAEGLEVDREPRGRP